MRPVALALVIALAWLMPAIATAAGRPSAPPEPEVRPIVPERGSSDRDDDRIDDRLEREQARLRHRESTAADPDRRERARVRLAEPRTVELVFRRQVTQAQIDGFLALGGEIGHVFRNVSYGFTGRIALESIDALVSAMGADLVAVESDRPLELHLDEATRTGRVRGVWAAGFASSETGYSGSADTTIAIIDTGIDDSHADLAGRIVYWKDFAVGASTPVDPNLHGTHVAGIAAGSGESFGEGPGTLSYTETGSLQGAEANGGFINPIHLAGGQMTWSGTASWFGGGTADLHFASRPNASTGKFDVLESLLAAMPPASLDIGITGDDTRQFTGVLAQGDELTVTRYAVAAQVTDYPGVGDGFPALRGVASGTRLAGFRVFASDGSGMTSTIMAALDELVTQRKTHRIQVANLSFGGGINHSLRSKVDTVVKNGIVAVCSGGNDGPQFAAADPSRSRYALTVVASNDRNELTAYSSVGTDGSLLNETMKPDVVAPGGSVYHSYILAPDTNDNDGSGMNDRSPDDYQNVSGTSMAAPFTAGSAALVIEALEESDVEWDFDSPDHALLVKMLLSASATETNATRELNVGSSPSLGRAVAPKDQFEGYGMINPDAAIEAVRLEYSGGELAGATDGGRFDRRAWGRHVSFAQGPPLRIDLVVPETADFDIYLVSGEPDEFGAPVLLAWSTRAGEGVDEGMSFVPTGERAYLFVKRVSGHGAWSLSDRVAPEECGDRVIVGQEICDDGNVEDGDCCSSSCEIDEDGTPCDDGLYCTTVDVCTAGACGGTGDPCAGGAECNATCNEELDNCAAPSTTPCAPDDMPCSVDRCDGFGSCTHAIGNFGLVCRASAGPCDKAETCTGDDLACPVDTYATNTVCRGAVGRCDKVERCTGTGVQCPADVAAVPGTVCRSSAGACDIVETCDGSSFDCPFDAVKPAATSCADDGNDCTDEFCDGTSARCQFEDNEAPCDDGKFCNGADTCSGGACLVHAGNPCAGADGDGDCSESCHEASDSCTASDPDASPCDDGRECTTGETCESGACTSDTTGCPSTTTTTLPPDDCGDANDDGQITTADALVALRSAVGATSCPAERCDYTGDGEVATTDALAILKRAVGGDVEGNCSGAAAIAVSTSTTLPAAETSRAD